MWPPQQRNQAPSIWVVEAEAVGDGVAYARAAGGRQRAAVGVGERAAVLVDGAAVGVDQAAEVVERVAVLRPQREALAVDPRQAGRVRARIGRVEVAAEVERLGVAGLDHAR